jgi:GntR family transcriptional repressor for pyruvate dehydrogenase complex
MEPRFQIRQVRKTKVYEVIVDQLKKSILRREIREGERLPTERELAEQFAVSRVSIRQALTVLNEMGLVESRPGGGTLVSNGIKEKILYPLAVVLNVEKEILEEPLEVRRLIEPEVTRLAAIRASAKDMGEMARIIALQEAKEKQGGLITDEDTLFHEMIAKSTENSILVKLVQFLHQHLKASREQSLIVPGGVGRSIQDHKKILNAITRKDPKAAYQAMVDHLRNVERLIGRALQERGERPRRR